MRVIKNKLIEDQKNRRITDLKEKDEIFEDLKKKYNGRVFLVSTKEIAKNKSAWATKVALDVFGVNRTDLKKERVHFSYIKFARSNKHNVVFGIVGGKSQFHHKYRSDVRFYDINTRQKHAARFMIQNELVWDEDEILILKNINNDSKDEAYKNETILQMDYKLFS